MSELFSKISFALLATETTTGKPSTPPPQPRFSIEQLTDDGFAIKLATDVNASVSPVKNTIHDGFSDFTGVFVVFSEGTKFRTVYIDASGRDLYNDKLSVDASYGTYEIAVSTANINGRSILSPAKKFKVDTSIRPVNVVRIVEKMAIDPSASPYVAGSTNSSYDTSANILLTWNAPLYAGIPPLIGYTIIRTEWNLDSSGIDVSSNVTTIKSDTSANLVNAISYVTDSSYSYEDVIGPSHLGVRFTYNIVGYNSVGNGEDGIFVNSNTKTKLTKIRAVRWPSVPDFKTTPSDGQSIVNIDVSGGYDLSLNYVCDVSYNGLINGFTNVKRDISGNNPLTITGLTNNEKYRLQARGIMSSPNMALKTYTSNYHNVKETTPINNIPPISDLSASNVDFSNNGLDGSIKLSWKNPTNISSFSGINYVIEKKIASSPDDSYSFDSSAIVQDDGSVNVTVNSLMNGSNYSFRVYTQYNNTETQSDIQSSKSDVTKMPFKNPTKSSDVSLNSINSFSDLSYSFLDLSNNGSGLPTLGHRYTLYNINNGGSEKVVQFDSADGSFNVSAKRGLLSTLFTGLLTDNKLNPGTRYALDVEPYINVEGSKQYANKFRDASGNVDLDVASLPGIMWTRPTGINSLVIKNVDASGVPLSTDSTNGGVLQLNWAYPIGQDASNMSFHIYNTITSNVTLDPSNQNLTNNYFTLNNLTVGVPFEVRVLTQLNATNGVSSITSQQLNGETATYIDVSGTPVYHPDKVQNVNIQTSNGNKIDVSFNTVSIANGLDSLRYSVQLYDISFNNGAVDVNVDPVAVGSPVILPTPSSGNVVTTSYTSNVAPGKVYRAVVTTQGLNTMTKNYVDSSGNSESINIATYNNPVNVTLFEVKPSDAAIVSKWSPIDYEATGLKFDMYQVERKLGSSPDGSFNRSSLADINESTLALSTVDGANMNNNVAIDTRIRTAYKNVLNEDVYSEYATKITVTPVSKPAAPTDISVSMNSTGTGATIKWNKASSVSSYSIVIEGSGNTLYHFEADSIALSSLTTYSEDNTKWQYVIPASDHPLTPGGNYRVKIFSEILTSGTVYTSSDAAVYDFQAYQTPDAPVNIKAVMANQSISLSWDLPTNTGGQGNDLKFKVYLSNGTKDASGNYNILQVGSIVAQDVSNSTLTASTINGAHSAYYNIDASGLQPIKRLPIKFTNLTNLTQYVAVIKSYFTIESSNQESDWVSVTNLYPRPAPNQPTVVPLLLDPSGGTRGSIQLTISSDASFNLSKYELYRTIYDASNTSVKLVDSQLISTKPYNLGTGDNNVSPDAGTIKRWVVTDNNMNDVPLSNGQTRNFNSPYWLNGNQFEYVVKAYYNDNNLAPQSGSEGDVISDSTEASITPNALPYPCLSTGVATGMKAAIMTRDASNVFTYLVNKNGSNINSVNVLGLDASNVFVLTRQNGNFDLSNALVDASNGIAQHLRNNVLVNDSTAPNQVVEIKVKLSSSNADNLSDLLAISANERGTGIAIWPADGQFSTIK